MERIATLIAVIIIAPTIALAAGSVSQTWQPVTDDVTVLTFSWTADSSNGSVPATATVSDVDAFVFMVVTNPGTTAPTDDYDITLTDEDGVDIMGGNLADRDEANSEQAVLTVTRFVSGTLTLNITNNSVNSATGTVAVYLKSSRAE